MAVLFLGLVSVGLIILFPALLILIAMVAAFWIGTVVYRRRKRQQARQAEVARWLASGIEDVDRMDGAAFEYRVRVAMESQGWAVSQTGGTGDFGCDLLAQSGTGHSVVVQCKCYSGSVGPEAVQQVFAARAHYAATDAWVITNSTFTPAARRLASSCSVTLIERQQLIDLLAAGHPQPAPPTEPIRSPDGRWWWDGSQWLAVPQIAHGQPERSAGGAHLDYPSPPS